VLDGRRLSLAIRTPSSTRRDVRELKEAPLLSLNLPRRLAAEGLVTGKHLELQVFDPATLTNAPMSLDVKGREVVVVAGRPIPVFRVETRFSGLSSTTFVTDLGEVLREESPSGLFIVREPQEQAVAPAVPGAVQTDLLEASAVVPQGGPRIDDPVSVEKLRLRLSGVDFSPAELQGDGQSFSDGVLEVRNLREARPGSGDAAAARFLDPEPFIESDAPEIRRETEKALERVPDNPDNPSARAEKLVRYVNSLLEKKPTVSLPSALEVLRTKVGDCNEHAVLLVAMARAARIPARLAVGLVYLHGAFYYHAWAELYIAEPRGEGLWLPVDPTLNQFPADATHLRFARGGLDQQAAIAKLLGRLRITVLGVDTRPGTVPILVGRGEADTRPPDIPLPRRDSSGPTCWSRPSS
jgi:transglutaminase-like putative cysteine protease